jgi:hypothetical protein
MVWLDPDDLAPPLSQQAGAERTTPDDDDVFGAQVYEATTGVGNGRLVARQRIDRQAEEGAGLASVGRKDVDER